MVIHSKTHDLLICCGSYNKNKNYIAIVYSDRSSRFVAEFMSGLYLYLSLDYPVATGSKGSVAICYVTYSYNNLSKVFFVVFFFMLN